MDLWRAVEAYGLDSSVVDTVRWGDFVNTVMNSQLTKKKGANNFLINRTTINVTTRTLLPAVRPVTWEGSIPDQAMWDLWWIKWHWDRFSSPSTSGFSCQYHYTNALYLFNHRCRYTGCPRRNGQNFGRVFLMLNYTDITQTTYIQSWTVTEIMAREVWNFDSCYTLIDYQIHIKSGRNMWFL